MEEMRAFFTARVADYDRHMLEEVEGCREGYELLAAALPEGIRDVLDLGCGTGLELGPIFARFPTLAVTGVDLTPAMLDRCREKFADRNLTLIEGDYLVTDFGECRYDAVISFESLHHFDHEQKQGLYNRLFAALRPGGVLLQCDYLVDTDEEEAHWRSVYQTLLQESGQQGADGTFHFDLPFSIPHEQQVLQNAGFAKAEVLWRMEGTALLKAEKA